MDIYTALKSASKLENFILSEFDFKKGMYSTTFAKLNSISEKCEMVHSKIQSCVKLDKDLHEEDLMKKAIELANQLNDVLDRISSNGSTISSSYDDMVNLHDTVRCCADKLGIDTSEHDPPKSGLDEKLDMILCMLKGDQEHIVSYNKDISLTDDTNELELALLNPKGFLEVHPQAIIIDVIQKAPKLLNEIEITIDEQRKKWLKEDKKRELMFVLTGSNQFELQQGISVSLAGRAAVFNMFSKLSGV